MTPERFAALADAYGGNLDRWPSAERDAGRRHLQSRPEARDDLAAAAKLDAALAAWIVPGPGTALAARIAVASNQRNAYARRLRLWLSSLGAATALASGVAAGAAAVVLSFPAAKPVAAPLYELNILGVPLDLEAQLPTSGQRQ